MKQLKKDSSKLEDVIEDFLKTNIGQYYNKASQAKKPKGIAVKNKITLK